MVSLRHHVTSRVAGEAASYAANRMPLASQALMSPIDLTLVTRHDAARTQAGRLREEFPWLEAGDLARRTARRMTARAGVSGAATGGLAAVPAVGTAAAAVAVTADLGLTLAAAAELVMVTATLHGYEDQTLEERRTWVLAVLWLAFEDPPGTGPDAQVIRPGGAAATAALSDETRARVNRLVVERLIARLGLRAGVLRLGRLLPMGLGAAVGGVGNTTFMRAVGRSADAYFAPPSGPRGPRSRRRAGATTVIEGVVVPGSRHTSG